MKRHTPVNTAILGATGLIGQSFVHMLSGHPFFKLSALIGSAARSGQRYGEAVNWRLPSEVPAAASEQTLEEYSVSALKDRGIKIVFSALPSQAAGEIESALRRAGFYVFSNSSTHRGDPDVPVLVPDVNPDALGMIRTQGYPGSGFIVTNPNCSTSGLVTALSPLRNFGIKEVTVSTYQSVSGAGYPGVPSMDTLGIVIPHIEGEESKVITETRKILGINIPIFATCMRVPAMFGHIESVWMKLEAPVSAGDIIHAWEQTGSLSDLPSLPERPVIYMKEPGLPGNHMAFRGNPPGMQVFTGGVRVQGDRAGFNLLVNNLIRGGAGGSVANAEFFEKNFGVNP